MIYKFSKTTFFLSIILLYSTIMSCAQKQKEELEQKQDYTTTNIANNWVLTDALGRKTTANSHTLKRNEKKLVGMFYWSWHVGKMTDVEPINVSKIISKSPEATNDYDHDVWIRSGRHHWGEPIFDYYISTDKWVLRKHAEMLADAGVDFIIFDSTNPSWLWDEAFEAIGEVWTQARKDGIKAPDIAFMMPFTPHKESKEMIERLYETYYKKEMFKDLWFYWKGKPFIMGYPDNVNEEVQSFFTFRPGQPAYKEGPKREDHWAWLEIYPQHGFAKNDDGSFEQVAVGVSQNATKELWPAAMNDVNQSFGRSYTQKGGLNTSENAVDYGFNFQEQWDRAFEIDPQIVFVTGWNEWTAGRYEEWQGTKNAFPDQYNQEYSRDIEPMKGGHQDNYYCQLVENIRKFKGVNIDIVKVSTSNAIKIDGDINDWKMVSPLYKDHKNNINERASKGYGSKYYSSSTVENDIIESKVNIDGDFIYFLVTTSSDIALSRKQNMMLLLDIDRNSNTGWQGYDYVINRIEPSQGTAVLEKHLNDFNWEKHLRIEYKINENMMELKITKTILDNNTANFEFKWWDNPYTEIKSIADCYVNGDAAPSGRFNYIYKNEFH
jgi:hypothetical protein